MDKTIVVRPEHLNHVGSLFGGYMMQWADEQAFIAATLHFPGSAFVTKLFKEFNFHAPAGLGDIIVIQSEVIHTGTTSCTVSLTARNLTTHKDVFSTEAVMVNVKNGVKAPLADVAPKPQQTP